MLTQPDRPPGMLHDGTTFYTVLSRESRKHVRIETQGEQHAQQYDDILYNSICTLQPARYQYSQS